MCKIMALKAVIMGLGYSIISHTFGVHSLKGGYIVFRVQGLGSKLLKGGLYRV